MLNAVTDDLTAPAFVLRLDTSELFEANSAARALWGMDDDQALPRRIDRDMPALRDIRDLDHSPTASPAIAATEYLTTLVFWTDRGAQRLKCRCRPMKADESVLVIVERPDAGATSPANSKTAQDEENRKPPDQDPAAATAVDLRTMAHELRTPIGAVIALADMIDQEQFGPIGDPRYREYARDIRDSAHLALNIVASALEHDPGNETILIGGISEIEPETLLRKARRALRLNAQSAGLTIEVETPPALPLLLANPPALNQILLNLTANAVKFTPPGGQIVLAAASTEEGGLDVAVVDTGIGMTEYETSVLVEPAVRAGSAGQRENTEIQVSNEESMRRQPPAVLSGPDRGIGFTLVRRLASAMGARLDVSSERGVGTRVALRFPPSRLVPRPSAGNGA